MTQTNVLQRKLMKQGSVRDLFSGYTNTPSKIYLFLYNSSRSKFL